MRRPLSPQRHSLSTVWPRPSTRHILLYPPLKVGSVVIYEFPHGVAEFVDHSGGLVRDGASSQWKEAALVSTRPKRIFSTSHRRQARSPAH